MLNPALWTDLARTSMVCTAVALESQAVIWMRLWGMAGWWNVTSGENRRMVSEKLAAGAAAQAAVATALMTGKAPLAVMDAAMGPVRKRTRSNLRRLSRRGLKY